MFILEATAIWIKPEFGGRSKEPVIGLKPTIRFQKYISEWLKISWDVEIIDLKFEKNTWGGEVKMKFVRNTNPNKEWIKEGELFELLDAYRVIAVGKIKNIITTKI